MSIRYYSRAASQGHAAAQAALGTLYEKGQGVAQDYAEAARYYQLAADQGHADSQAALGAMYEKGLGVDQDYAQAAK